MWAFKQHERNAEWYATHLYRLLLQQTLLYVYPYLTEDTFLKECKFLWNLGLKFLEGHMDIATLWIYSEINTGDTHWSVSNYKVIPNKVQGYSKGSKSE